ncbi:hypothetical protein [Streptomyces sp. S.PNR 29]|uniref:hypothetical protein n=1 Tax=Streptomyces sp. S.PNR 29 TaxID=2973805 RepID=UPI0025B12B2B|nr:hypothetical protein [Streptomyces sp. S.PNR 29]MDN0201103.1 hypothetical protein [Streptomyces sp. S.PNR 29]
MTAGGCSRTLRAAVFTAVCVLLASLGHVMMSGTAVPWWAMAAGAAVTGGTAWRLADRERGPVVVGSVMVAAQAVLHSSFSLAQAVVHPQTSGGRAFVQQWLGRLLCGSPPDPGTAHGATGTTHSIGSMDHMGAAHPLDHGMGGTSSTGMLAAHLLAALLCGLWLAHGERAAFRILRVLAGWLVTPLRLILRLPAPPHRPRVRARRGGSDRKPRQLLLTHTITSRGPPTGTAVA